MAGSGGIESVFETPVEGHFHSYAIVGGSFTGISCYRTLMKILVSSGTDATRSTVVFEKGRALGSASPLNSPNGANILSFNIDDTTTQQRLRLLEEDEHCVAAVDDGLLYSGMLSRTKERPTGWNRVIGQWQHYRKRKPLKDILSSLLPDGNTATNCILCNKKVTSIEYVPDRGCWRIHSDDESNLETFWDSQALVLALPPRDTLAILQVSQPSLTGVVKEGDLDTTMSVLQAACDRCIKRYTRSIKVKRECSLGSAVEAKFKELYCDSASTREGNHRLGDMVYELDVSQSGSKEITLISNIVGVDVDSQQEDGTTLHLAIHALKEEVLSRDKLLEWLWLWTGLHKESECEVLPDDLAFDSQDVHVFAQAPMGVMAPLSPLRERGYILLSESPILALAGDYCISSSCVSSAMLSGDKTARAIVDLQKKKE